VGNRDGGGGGHRLILQNLPIALSREGLRDEMRRIGEVLQVSVELSGHGSQRGVVEFASPSDLAFARSKLDGSRFRGHTVEAYAEARPGGTAGGGGGSGGGSSGAGGVGASQSVEAAPAGGAPPPTAAAAAAAASGSRGRGGGRCGAG